MPGVRTAQLSEEHHGLRQDLVNGEAIGHQVQVTVSSCMFETTSLVRKKPRYGEASAPEMNRLIAGIQVDEHVRARHHLPHVRDVRVLLAALAHLVSQALQPLSQRRLATSAYSDQDDAQVPPTSLQIR